MTERSVNLVAMPLFCIGGYGCGRSMMMAGGHTVLISDLRVPDILALSPRHRVTHTFLVPSVACAAGMGKVAVPETMRRGHDARLATGAVAAAGTGGTIIPPSILLVVFDVIGQVPITGLFPGAIGVGVLTALARVRVILVRVRRNPARAPSATEAVPLPATLGAPREAAPVLVLMAGVLGGLFAGLFTATQAGAVGAMLSVAIAFAQRSLGWRGLARDHRDARHLRKHLRGRGRCGSAGPVPHAVGDRHGGP